MRNAGEVDVGKRVVCCKIKMHFLLFQFPFGTCDRVNVFSLLLDICVKFAVNSESDEMSYFDETFLFKKISCMCNQVLCLFY